MRKTRHPAVSARDPSKNRKFFYQRFLPDARRSHGKQTWSRFATQSGPR